MDIQNGANMYVSVCESRETHTRSYIYAYIHIQAYVCTHTIIYIYNITIFRYAHVYTRVKI